MVRRDAFVWTFAAAMMMSCGFAVGQEPSKDNRSPGPAAKDVPTKSDSSKTSDVTTGGAKKTPGLAPLPAVFAEDLKLTPPYAYLVAVMRPARMSELRGVRDIPGADLAGPNPVKPSEVERVVATIYPKGSAYSEFPYRLAIGFALQLRTTVPREKIAAWLSPRAKPDPQDDNIYLNSGSGVGDDPVLGFSDDRTIFVSSDPDFVFSRLRSLKSHDNPPHALAPFFTKLDPEAQAVAAADLDKLRHFAQAFRDASSWDRKFGTLTEAMVNGLESLRPADSLQLAVNLSKLDGLVLRTENGDPGKIDQFAKIARNALVGHVEAGVATFRESLGEQFTEKIQSVERRLKAIVETSTSSREKDSYALQSQQLPAAAETLKLVADVGALHVEQMQRRLVDLRFGNKMRELGLAIHNYHDVFVKLPRDILSKDGKPLLSWRVAILPFLERSADLYKRFHLDEPWDSDHNITLLKSMPAVYQGRGQPQPTKTPVQWVTGAGTGGAAKALKDLKGQTTLALIESRELVEWTRPGDFVFDRTNPGKGLLERGSFGILHDAGLVHLSPGMDRLLLRSAFLDDGAKVDVGRLLYQHSPSARFRSGSPPVRLTDDELTKLLSQLDGSAEADRLKMLVRLGQRRSSGPRSQAVVDQVSPLLGSTSPLVRSHALRAIRAWSRHGRVDWKRLATVLADPYEANRWMAIDLLAEFAEPELARALLRLPEQDSGVAGRLLYRNYVAIAADAALPLLKDSSAVVRARACALIGETGNDSHLAPLEAMLKDKDQECRDAAKEALGQLRQQGPLVEAVKEFKGNTLDALKKVAKRVETNEDGDVIDLDLTEFETPYHLVRSDFPVLAKLSHLKSLKLAYTSIVADDVAHWKALPLEELEVNYCPRLGDGVAASLRHMKTLRVLRLDKSNVGDETARAVGELKNLQELNMSFTRVSDLGLAHLAKLPDLERLDLSDTRISDRGLAAIAKHANLQRLYLLNTGITDACLEYLATLRGLEFLNLSGSEVSPEGLARLRKALPNCDVLPRR